MKISNSFEFPATEGEAPNMAMMLEAVMEMFNAYFSPIKNKLLKYMHFANVCSHQANHLMHISPGLG